MASIKPIAPEHFEQLASFLAEFPDEGRYQEHWRGRMRLWWEDNPAVLGELPRGWGLWENGRLVGCLGNIPTRMQSAGGQITVFNATAWRVLPEYRGQSLGLFFFLISAAQSSLLFCTTPSPTALDILKGLKFKTMPGAQRQYQVRLTYTRPLELRLGRAGALAAALPNLLRGLSLGRSKPPAGLRLEETSWADQAWDRLWEATRAGQGLTNVRDAATVNWLCRGHADLGKILLACRRGDELLGYALARQVGRPGDQGLECLDLWCDPAQPQVREALLGGLLDLARARSLDLLMLHPFGPELAASLQRWGLGAFRPIARQHFYMARGELLQAVEQGGCYLCCLQGDVGL